MDTVKLMRWLVGLGRQTFTAVMARNIRACEAALEEAEADLIAARDRSSLCEKGLTMLDELVDETEERMVAIHLHAHGCPPDGRGRGEDETRLCGKRDAEGLPCLRHARHAPPCQPQGVA